MTQKKFSTNLSFILKVFIGLNLIAAIAFLSSKKNSGSYFVVYMMNAVVFLSFFFRKTVVEIHFIKDEIRITYWKMLIRKREVYKYEDIFWSDTRTLIARGNIGYVLKLHCNGEVIASLHTSSSGFDQETIDEIKEAIKESNIKQLLDG